MTRFDRAMQVWSLLVFCAHRREVVTYGLLARLTGLPRNGLGKVLEPIQSFCILKQLPPLTSLVVEEGTGRPGDGFVASRDLAGAQSDTYAFPWLDRSFPTPDDLREAVAELPSLGLSLRELMRDLGGGCPS